MGSCRKVGLVITVKDLLESQSKSSLKPRFLDAQLVQFSVNYFYGNIGGHTIKQKELLQVAPGFEVGCNMV